MNEQLKHLPGLLLGTLALALCAVINPLNHYFSALLLVTCAVFLYFYIAIVPAKRNWWDIRAVFAAMWVFTIGLAALRLTDYQRQWESATWLLMAAAYAMFYLGATVGIQFGTRFYAWVKKKRGTSFGNIALSLQENRLFWICFGVTVFGIACFAANAAIRGYIPYFSNREDSYLSFYTKFYLFAVATTMISGLCYYTLKTQKLSVWKKVFLWFSIIYSTFLFPMLVVSRGVFMTAALSLTTAVFYLNKRRFLVLVLSALVIVAFYMKGTSARGYSETQLDEFFEPSTIVVEDNPNAEQFQLSGTASFLYSYLTVSHDNFNEAVRLTENFTYGVRQLMPFNVILRIDALNEVEENGESHLVRPHLNTVNLAGYAYYDFGAIGVAIFMFIWAVIYGMIQSFALEGNGPFAMMALGNTMTPVTLCCFAPWMSVFSHWVHWGFALVLFLIAAINKSQNAKSTLK